MANLTISVDEEVLLAARKRALDQGTSVNAILAEYLSLFAGRRATQESVVAGLLELARQNDAQTKVGPSKRRWTREELHERD